MWASKTDADLLDHAGWELKHLSVVELWAQQQRQSVRDLMTEVERRGLSLPPKTGADRGEVMVSM